MQPSGNDFAPPPQNLGVHARIDPSAELLSLAAWQAGVVTAEQAAAFDITRGPVTRLIRDGRWRRVTKGLYYASERTPDWNALAWSGILLGGPEARLGGEAAGHLFGLNKPPRLIEVMVPWTSVLKERESWRFVRERPGVRSARSVGCPPRLSVEDTVIDLAERATDEQVIALVTGAVQNRLTTAGRLRRTVAARSRLRHRHLFGDLLTDVAAGVHSPLELNYARDVERAHGLPRGKRQLRSRRGSYYRDVTYEEFQLIVELDGRLGHDGLGRFRDMRRDNLAILMGQLTLRYGWFDVVDRPCQVAWEVAAVLAARGWTAVPSRCHRCRHAVDLASV